MLLTIESSVNCEIRIVIGFFDARDVKEADIQGQITEVYISNNLGDEMVSKWITAIKDTCTKTYDVSKKVHG